MLAIGEITAIAALCASNPYPAGCCDGTLLGLFEVGLAPASTLTHPCSSLRTSFSGKTRKYIRTMKRKPLLEKLLRGTFLQAIFRRITDCRFHLLEPGSCQKSRSAGQVLVFGRHHGE